MSTARDANPTKSENQSPSMELPRIVKRARVVVIKQTPEISLDELRKRWQAELKSVSPYEAVEEISIPTIKEAVSDARSIFYREVAAGRRLGRDYQRAIKKLNLTLKCEECAEQFLKELGEKIAKRKLIITPEIQSTVIDPIYNNVRIIEMGKHGLLQGADGASIERTLREARQNLEIDLAELEHLLKTAPEQNALLFYEKEREKVVEKLNLKSTSEIPAVINWQLDRLRTVHHTLLLLELAPEEEQNGYLECQTSYEKLCTELDDYIEYFKKRPLKLAKLNGSAFFKGVREGEKTLPAVAKDVSKLTN